MVLHIVAFQKTLKGLNQFADPVQLLFTYMAWTRRSIVNGAR